MDDSDNSTTFPIVTRRSALLSGVAALLDLTPNISPRTERKPLDPVIAVWREWQTSQQHTDQLTLRQQSLEQILVERVGFPHVALQLRSGGTIVVHSLDEIREHGHDSSEDLRRAAETGLADHLARWNAVDHDIGYSTTLRAERHAGEKADEMLKTLFDLPALSLVGVAAKLEAVLNLGQPSQADTEFPWPQIHSVLNDVLSLASGELKAFCSHWDRIGD